MLINTSDNEDFSKSPLLKSDATFNHDVVPPTSHEEAVERQGEDDEISVKKNYDYKIFRFLASIFCLSLILTVGTLFVIVFLFEEKFTFSPKLSFNLHYFFSIMGGAVFFALGCVIFRLATNMSKLSAKVLHTTFHSIGLGLMLAGFTFIYIFKDENSSNHFYTLHSWMGTAFIALYILMYIFGILVFWLPLFSLDFKIEAKRYHTMLGRILIITLGFICFLGMGRYFWKIKEPLNLNNIITNFLGIGITGVVIVAAFILFNDEYKCKLE